MVPGIIEVKLATTLMAGWMAAASPVPVPSEVVALLLEAKAATPVEVKLYDENLRVDATVVLRRDGSTDPVTKKAVTKLFRCRVTNRSYPIKQRTLAMLADIADRYDGKTIEFVSAYRVQRGESRTSPHRDARAIDFRIRGVQLREIRDYLWRNYSEVGIGWYPSEQFIHMDSRPTLHDTAWTFLKGNNRYKPYWAELARRPESTRTVAARRPGS
ncbi:MAG: DUF882 domain-containing protein [Deltaproteobacteria bacterium]|nr:DUF882 domain-containing protein [Deltaproteobacteria bacterium]MDQ3295936.1 DUF882 domain-containing protein [Myxococcota bacterium]